MLPNNTTPKSKPNSYEHVQNSSNKIKNGEEVCNSAIEKSPKQENCSIEAFQHQRVPQHSKSTLRDKFKALKRKKDNIRRVLHYLAQKRTMYSNDYSGENAWLRAEGQVKRNAEGDANSNKKASNSMRISTKQPTSTAMTS